MVSETETNQSNDNIQAQHEDTSLYGECSSVPYYRYKSNTK